MTTTDTLLNRYRRVRLLGSGGFGAVYMAEDLRLGRTVAIKEMDARGLAPDEQAVSEQMFEREARMLASLDHPGLTRIWDYFQDKQRAFLVMEYVPGHTLREELNQRGGPLDEPFVIECALQLCNVLHYLHTRQPQVIFRDLKPANVMVVAQPPSPNSNESADMPLFRLIDFGIARLFKPEQTGDTLIIGTPGYAPPEQYGRGQTDARSDIYSLGVTLHQMLSGQPPASVPPPPVLSLNPAVSPTLARIVTRATQAEPADRYQSVEEMRRELLALRAANIAPAAPVPQAPPRLAQQPAPRLAKQAAPRVATPAPDYQPRVTTPLPAPSTTPRPPRQGASPLMLIVAVVLLGIVGLGIFGMRAFGRLSGDATPQPTVAPAAREWTLPGAQGTIAFGQQPSTGGGFDIWLATLDGSPPRQLTSDKRSYSPAWSPDGAQLSVTHDNDIYVGTGQNPLFQLLDLGGLTARYPAWSPDGTRLALATRKGSEPWRLAIYDLSSGQLSFPDAPGNIGGLAWAPGQRLAFAAPSAPGQPQDIFILDANGSAANLTNTPDAEEDLPAWSPDGRRIAFTTSAPGASHLNARQIAVMNSNGGGRTQLTAGSGPHTNAVWSPDGSWIAYVAKENSPDWQVWAMRADGSDPRVLTFGPERKFYLSWGR